MLETESDGSEMCFVADSKEGKIQGGQDYFHEKKELGKHVSEWRSTGGKCNNFINEGRCAVAASSCLKRTL